MSSTTSRTILASITVLLLLATPTALARDDGDSQPPEVTFQATELAPGLHVLIARGGFGGGNVGLLTGDDGVVMIDDSMPPFTGTLLDAVAGVAGGPPDFVINTHVHGDHLGGNPMVSEKGATIVAHDNVRQRLVDQGMPTGSGNQPAPPGSLPVLTFTDAVTFHLNGQPAHVFHVHHAHTDGDAVIHFPEADVIHMGDVFFHRVFPFIDVDNGGSVDGYVAAQKKVLELAGDETKIIPGHGPMADKAGLEASIAMLEDARAKIQALIDEGKSVDEILEADPLADHADLSWQFITMERMIRQVHRSLTASM